MNSDISCVFKSLRGIGAIYISNLTTANNLTLLRDLNIDAVLTIAQCGEQLSIKSEVTNYLYIHAMDTQDFQICEYFSKTFAFIDHARKLTNILIHCVSGVSRSASIVIAYLIKKYNYSFEQVLASVKRKRVKINPNKGFMKQLQMLNQNFKTENNLKEIRSKEIRSEEKTRRTLSHLSVKLNKRQECKQKINKKINEINNIKLNTTTILLPIKKYKIIHNQDQIQDKLFELRQKFISKKKLQHNNKFISQYIKQINFIPKEFSISTTTNSYQYIIKKQQLNSDHGKKSKSKSKQQQQGLLLQQ